MHSLVGSFVRVEEEQDDNGLYTFDLWLSPQIKRKFYFECRNEMNSWLRKI